mgnify:FL=1
MSALIPFAVVILSLIGTAMLGLISWTLREVIALKVLVAGQTAQQAEVRIEHDRRITELEGRR